MRTDRELHPNCHDYFQFFGTVAILLPPSNEKAREENLSRLLVAGSMVDDFRSPEIAKTTIDDQTIRGLQVLSPHGAVNHFIKIHFPPVCSKRHLNPRHKLKSNAQEKNLREFSSPFGRDENRSEFRRAQTIPQARYRPRPVSSRGADPPS